MFDYYNLYIKPNGLYVLKKVKNRFAYVNQDWLFIETFIYNSDTNTFQPYFDYIEFIRTHKPSRFRRLVNFINDL